MKAAKVLQARWTCRVMVGYLANSCTRRRGPKSRRIAEDLPTHRLGRLPGLQAGTANVIGL
jgi:hypothetical protein